MNVKERDVIAYLLCDIEDDGYFIDETVNILSNSDRKFRQVYE